MVRTGIVIGGAGSGESLSELGEAVRGVRGSIGEGVPILVQGMDSLEEV